MYQVIVAKKIGDDREDGRMFEIIDLDKSKIEGAMVFNLKTAMEVSFLISIAFEAGMQVVARWKENEISG